MKVKQESITRQLGESLSRRAHSSDFTASATFCRRRRRCFVVVIITISRRSMKLRSPFCLRAAIEPFDGHPPARSYGLPFRSAATRLPHVVACLMGPTKTNPVSGRGSITPRGPHRRVFPHRSRSQAREMSLIKCADLHRLLTAKGLIRDRRRSPKSVGIHRERNYFQRTELLWADWDDVVL